MKNWGVKGLAPLFVINMKKIILSIRNRLVNIAIEFDCCGLINENSLTETQRAKLQKEVRTIVQEIDNILIPKKK